jgi:uncharacterized lipoprotein YajG
MTVLLIRRLYREASLARPAQGTPVDVRWLAAPPPRVEVRSRSQENGAGGKLGGFCWRTQMNHPLLAACIVLAFAAVAPASAATNDPTVALRWSPQQAIGAATASLAPVMQTKPVRIVVEDVRPEQARVALGQRTDDDDRLHQLRTEDDVASFLEEHLRDVASAWGVAQAEDAELLLAINPTTYQVRETNQAVGATYVATVGLAATLRSMRTGQPLWQGRVTAEAKRYGRKFSNDNINEVLSDAALEAWAGLLSTVGLQEAWDTGTPAAAPPEPVADPVADPVAPEALLAELQRLREDGLGAQTLEAFVRRQVLSRPLSSDDLLRWKRAGIPEAVIREALELPVRR